MGSSAVAVSGVRAEVVPCLGGPSWLLVGDVVLVADCGAPDVTLATIEEAIEIVSQGRMRDCSAVR
jgi:hypothetical protein